MKKVMISILHYNNSDATDACLDSLQNIIDTDIEVTILVVDNGSKDIYVLPDIKNKTIQLFRNEKNLGFSGGQNIAIRQARALDMDAVLILNNDTTVDKQILLHLITAAKNNTNVGIVSPKIYYTPGSEYHKEKYEKKDLGHVLWYAGGSIDWKNVSGKHRGVDEVDDGQYDTSEEISFATGCCMLLTKEVIDKVGIFDERYFLYYEDADLCERVKQKGFTLWYEPKAKVWHKNAAAGGGSGSSLQEYYVSRNRMLFGMTYGTIRVRIALLKESISLLRHGRAWQKKGITDFYLRNLGKGSYM